MPIEPWRKFDSTIYPLFGGLLSATGVDTLFTGLFSLLDFRTWPWWYFLGLIAVLAFSARWFFLYQKKIDDEFDPRSLEEAKRFRLFSGTITGMLAVPLVLHRTGMM